MVDFIDVYDDSLDHNVCKDMIERFELMCDLKNPGILHNHTDTYDGFRKDTQINALKHGSLDWLTSQIKDSLRLSWSIYQKKYWPDITYEKDVERIPFDRVFYPDIKIQKSEPGGGYCSWHCEQGKADATRFAVWMIYLNDVPEGGATEFWLQNKSVQPKMGTTVIWPAGYSHFHRSAPDLKSDKYIATGWFVYESK